MKNLLLLITKEWRESIKEYKILWIPIVLILASIMQPVTMQILPKVVGSNDTLMVNPNYATPSGNEIFSGVFGQLNQFVIFTVAVTTMGCITSEKQSGVLELLFSKPITTLQYLLSKYLFYNILFLSSLCIGLSVGFYYTEIYYSSVSISLLVESLLFYSIWLWFIVSIGIMGSAILRNQIQSALVIFTIPILCLIINNFNGTFVEILNPGSLSKNAVLIMTNSRLTSFCYFNILWVIFLNSLCIYFSYKNIKITQKE